MLYTNIRYTLVVWGGEFGRTPMMEARTGKNFLGRDHHNEAFTMWIAGAGIKKGILGLRARSMSMIFKQRF